MKPLKIHNIVLCLLLVLSVAGCTNFKTTTPEKKIVENEPIASQPRFVHDIEKPTQFYISKQPISTDRNKVLPVANGNLTVHFIDVGQGDSILLEHGDDTMLIDSGEIDKEGDVAAKIKNEGINSLDYVVATHPHSDHIGGMSALLEDFAIGHFVDSGYTYTSKTSENMLTTIDKKNIPFITPKRGEKIDFSSGIDIQVMNPNNTYFPDDVNQNSIVLKVTDGKVSFLLMGDAGIEAENAIIQNGYNVNADILKVGHHGSRTSSGASFISAVSPEVSVIEVGAGNDYKHPHKETLDRLEKVSKVYRTDQDGTITITTDGSMYSVTTQKAEPVEEVKSVTQKTKTIENMTSSSTEPSAYVSALDVKNEWIKITNKGSSPVSLIGWEIKDEGGKHTYTFPSYILDSGASVTVKTEKGQNLSNELYWETDGPIWNNDGDTAYLYDSSGKLVSSLER